MLRFKFKRLYDDLSRRVEIEGKTNPSWLMGYLQGKGSKTLTGLQCAALIDLLLVPLEKNLPAEKKVLDMEIPEKKSETVASTVPGKLTLAQR